MKKYFSILISITLLLTVIGCGNATNEGTNQAGEVTDKPTITLGNPPYQHVWFINGIIQNIAEELGYPVEIAEGEIGVIFTAISQGNIDIYPDVWSPSLHSTYIEKYKDSVELVGTLYEKAPIGWAVPSYVDIQSIEDLKGRETEFKGRVVGYESGAGQMMTSEEIIEGYGLDYELVSGSVPTMLAEVKKATMNQEPVVFLAWRPHTMFQLFDIKLLDDPKGYFQQDDVRSGVSKDLKEKAPDLYSFLEGFQISIDDIELALLKIEEENADPVQLAKEWVEQNRSSIDQLLQK